MFTNTFFSSANINVAIKFIWIQQHVLRKGVEGRETL